GIGALFRGEGRSRGAPSYAPMGAQLVVVGHDAIELGLQLLLGLGRILFGQEALQGLVEAFDLATGLRVVGPRVFRGDAQRQQLELHGTGCGSTHGLRPAARWACPSAGASRSGTGPCPQEISVLDVSPMS